MGSGHHEAKTGVVGGSIAPTSSQVPLWSSLKISICWVAVISVALLHTEISLYSPPGVRGVGGNSDQNHCTDGNKAQGHLAALQPGWVEIFK